MKAGSGLLISCFLWGALGLAPGPGWGNGAPPGPVLTEQDSGKSVTLKVGEQLTLNLRNPASGGYTVAAPVFDERVLRLISRETRPPEPAAPPRLGDFGRLVFVFAAAAPGATDLAVKISREWEKDQPPLDYVKYMVKVVP